MVGIVAAFGRLSVFFFFFACLLWDGRRLLCCPQACVHVLFDRTVPCLVCELCSTACYQYRGIACT